MPQKRKVSDDALLADYAKTGSVWKTADNLGICGQSVHERLVKLGKNVPVRVFTDAEITRLRNEYEVFADAGKLNDLALSMGRSKHLLCRQARALGITDQGRKRPYGSVWKYLSDGALSVIWGDFKKSRLGLNQYCRKKGYDALGFSRKMKVFAVDEYSLVIELKAPKQSLYRLGRAVEYRVRDFLKERGYFAMRAPQSKGKVDVVAVANGIVLFIQCKRSGALGVNEWNEVFDLASSCGAIPLMACMGKAGKGLEFWRLNEKKDGSKKRQPMSEYVVPTNFPQKTASL